MKIITIFLLAQILISGRVTHNGRGVPRAQVHISGSCGSWQGAMARTNPFGYYSATAPSDCQNLGIVPSHKTFSFVPNSRIYIFIDGTPDAITADFEGK